MKRSQYSFRVRSKTDKLQETIFQVYWCTPVILAKPNNNNNKKPKDIKIFLYSLPFDYNNQTQMNCTAQDLLSEHIQTKDLIIYALC